MRSAEDKGYGSRRNQHAVLYPTMEHGLFYYHQFGSLSMIRHTEAYIPLMLLQPVSPTRDLVDVSTPLRSLSLVAWLVSDTEIELVFSLID